MIHHHAGRPRGATAQQPRGKAALILAAHKRGLDTSSIAAEVGCTPGNVRAALRRWAARERASVPAAHRIVLDYRGREYLRRLIARARDERGREGVHEVIRACQAHGVCLADVAECAELSPAHVRAVAAGTLPPRKGLGNITARVDAITTKFRRHL